MGKASSNKKVARAARTGGRPGAAGSRSWPLRLVVILGVAAGIFVIIASRGKTEDSVAPKLGDHWHAAYGIYDCDHFIDPLEDQVQDESGLHTHADGLMHMHPFGTRFTGKGANIGNWGLTTGLKVTDSSIEAAGMDRKNGDRCDGKKGTLQLKVWDSPDDDEGHLIEKDFADYNPQEFTIWVLAFVPEGTDIPKPPQSIIDALRAPADVTGQSTTSVPTGSTETTAPGSTETTAPGSTETTAPAGSSSTTEPSTTVPTTSP